MNIHYTPSLDEFHDQLIYEEYIDGEWKQMKFKLKPQFDIFNTRIKYLDENDIISLGFRSDGKFKNAKRFIKEVESITSIEYIELLYYRKADEPFVSLYSSNDYPLFNDINIKNISELKWLLTRYAVV